MPNVEEKDFHPKRNDDEWRRQVETLLATDQVRPASEVGSGSFI